ncbi:MAG: beta-propeller fold lactonase family protein [Kiritimatiellia bacterium]|jgi:YVTN family beta-propeller protein|nr:beta-propeller fold lactonase family protein [Kiritimatiellia bacterium]MDP6848466.1 beta-propeller fold lactonase family protein [Kiritimatiellia bacterium]
MMFLRLTGLIGIVACLCGPASGALYRSPLSVAVSSDGKTLYVSDKTAGCLVVLNAEDGRKIREVAIEGGPRGVALSADGNTLYVAQRKANSIALVDPGKAVVTGNIAVGTWPGAIAVDSNNRRLYSCNRGNHTVSVVDLAEGKQVKQVAVVRDPAFAAITADGSRLIVPNFMPLDVFTNTELAAEVSIIDTASMKQVARVKLPPGSTMAAGAWVDPKGRWAYVVHMLGRFDLPVTQLQHGWVHTCALSIIDVAAGTRLATILLDDLNRGVADPRAVVGSADGETLWISHSGVHEVSTLNIGRIHELLAGNIPVDLAGLKDGGRDNIWIRIKNDRKEMDELSRDLTALHISGTISRTPSGGNGPAGLALSPDENTLYVVNYYTGTVGVLDAVGGKLLKTFPVGKQPKPDAARRGEIYFHDATRCLQSWHSCASCHLDGGRIDGLPWDFMRDGINNGKDVISLVNMHHTPPHNRLATRANPLECMVTGVLGSHGLEADPGDVDDLLAYVKSLTPELNPNIPKFAGAARRGKVLFEGKAKCSSCHPAPYFTNREMYDVGIHSPNEPGARYDTPSLIEAYRTAPYYHDGRAVTIKDALSRRNDPKGLHGKLRVLSPQELDDLVAYVLSL